MSSGNLGLLKPRGVFLLQVVFGRLVDQISRFLVNCQKWVAFLYNRLNIKLGLQTNKHAKLREGEWAICKRCSHQEILAMPQIRCVSLNSGHHMVVQVWQAKRDLSDCIDSMPSAHFL